MDALTILLWILAGIGGVVLLTIIAVVSLLIWAASLGIRRMREVDAKDTEIYRGGVR